MFVVDTKSKLLVKIPDVLTHAECAELIHRIDSLNPKVAPINTAGGTRVRTDVRSNERVMFDDIDLASRLFEKAVPHVPARMLGSELVGANERFRCYRYKPGMRFAAHKDGSFERNESEKSFYTYLIYLNDGFEGGETNFATSPELSIKPVAGMGLVFQHPIIHEGAEVRSGVKYVARTDLMFRRTGG
jgi:prolyl 4-hydroxylase